MPTFLYTAQGPSGLIQGQLDASDRAEAFSLLGRKRLQPVRLEQAGSAGAAGAAPPAARGMSRSPARPGAAADARLSLRLPQLVLFTEELADLLGAGIQLEPALATMERRRELTGVKTLASSLREKIRDGMAFSKALAATSPSFGNLFCAMASAGEASGTLPAILKRQAEFLRSLQALRGKVLFAMIYPAFLVAASVAVTLLFVLYLIPKLTELLDSNGGTLPLAAPAILGLSTLVKSWWWMGLLGLLCGGILLRAWLAQPSSAIPWARFKLRLPLFGPVLASRFQVQFLETMANLVGNGLPMVNALQLTHQAMDNPWQNSGSPRSLNWWPRACPSLARWSAPNSSLPCGWTWSAWANKPATWPPPCARRPSASTASWKKKWTALAP
jgi:type II secretory pathway component PulF